MSMISKNMMPLARGVATRGLQQRSAVAAQRTFARNMCAAGKRGQGEGGHPSVLPHDTLAPFNPVKHAPEALVLIGLLAVPLVFAARNIAVMAPETTWDPETRGDFEKRLLRDQK